MPEPAVTQPVALAEKLQLFEDLWSPRIVARLNDYEVKVVKLQGEFTWHEHADTDEFFLVLSGSMAIQMRERTVTLREGELFIVPRGVEHCPLAENECHVLLIEPRGVVNTGAAGGPQTAEGDRWV
jgi:mannose-6-phosphate isomerase-like protein (cupin superfamily)